MFTQKTKQLWGSTAPRLLALALVSAGAVWAARAIGIATKPRELIAVGTFAVMVCSTVCFWNHRLAVSLLCVATLVATRTLSVADLAVTSRPHIILFLAGMMILVGILQEMGLFSCLVQMILANRTLTGFRFVVAAALLGVLVSAVAGEAVAIIVVLALVFQVCDTLRVPPTPFAILSVLAVNIGSALCMLGNPVAVFIGIKADCTFVGFIRTAAPVVFAALAATVVVFTLAHLQSIRELTAKLVAHRAADRDLGPVVGGIPVLRIAAALALVLLPMVFHPAIERLIGFSADDGRHPFLMVAPLALAAAALLIRPERARRSITEHIDWPSLFFLLALFIIAGAIEKLPVAANAASRIAEATGRSSAAAIPLILVTGALGSAFVDNMTFVAFCTPVIQALDVLNPDYERLWWALLFGSSFGSNITLFGSTANVLALGMLKTRYRIRISFLHWLGAGLVVGTLTTTIAWLFL